MKHAAMKFPVPVWAMFLMFLFTASNSNTTPETYTLINTANLVKPGCASRCGDLIVPYPFGIGINSNCSIDPSFDLHCNTSLDPPKTSTTKTDYLSIKSISDSTVRTSNIVARRCYELNGSVSDENSISVNSTRRPYTVLEVNKFMVIGCNDYAWLTSRTESRNISTGCMAFCSRPEDDVGGECLGSGCCQSSIPEDISYYTPELRSLAESGDMNNTTRSFNPCTYAFIGEEKMFTFKGATDLNDSSFKERIEASVPIVLEWAIGNLSCAQAEKTEGFACQSNSKCVDSTRVSGGYRCMCREGYHGNPYLSPGCQDINECDDKKNYPCYGTCVNSNGSYTCKCKHGRPGNATIRDGCRRKPFAVLQVSLAIGTWRLSWDIRLRIACESAGALAYLHSATSMPIIHRDVKSSDILLDDSYITKIADFDASRLVPLGHDEVTILVQGTVGYLDPEYFHTGQLTDRSDVYSFGVVLAELITSTKPLSMERSLEERNLATCFMKAMKENRLFQILEPQLMEEATVDQLKAICDLVRRCLNLVGGDRPSMKEVAMELETLRKIEKHPWASQDNNNEMSSFINESKQIEFYIVPLIPYMDTFGEYSSSSTGMKDMMLQVQSPCQ